MLRENSLFSKAKQGVIKAGLIAAAAVNACVPYYSSSDPFQRASTATSKLTSSLVSIARVLLPLSLVVLIIAILFTHDQKALSAELKTAALLCVAYIALIIVSNPQFSDWLKTLAGG